MMRQMKDSGVEWMGQIPEKWKVQRAKTLFLQRLTKGNQYTVLLAATQKHGMLPQSEVEGVVQVKEDADLQQFRTVHKNDFVISLRSFQGGFEFSQYEGVCSPAYQVFYSTKPICYSYYRMLFKSDGFIKKMNSLTVGIRDGKNIQYDDFANSLVPVPPLKEQEHIADYLDRKCAEIDAIIAKQQQIIEKLKEYKLSIITEAVTKGLDPNVPMKDSGVEWIGKVPEKWDISRIKYICVFNPKRKEINCNAFVSYAPMECVKDGYLIKKQIRYTDISTGLTSFEDGDIIMAKVTPCFENGNIAIAKDLINKFGVGSSELFVFRATKVNTRWLFYFLRNSVFKSLAKATMTGTGGLKRVSPDFVRDFSLALPPEKEQLKIVEFLDSACVKIDEIIKHKQEEVEKLNQYKKALIYEVVTGKMEV